MDSKHYRLRLIALLDQARELNYAIGALMDEVKTGRDGIGTAEWDFLYLVSRSVGVPRDMLSEAVWPHSYPSALEDATPVPMVCVACGGPVASSDGIVGPWYHAEEADALDCTASAPIMARVSADA